MLEEKDLQPVIEPVDFDVLLPERGGEEGGAGEENHGARGDGFFHSGPPKDGVSRTM